MPHECYDALIDSSLDVLLIVQYFGKCFCIALLSHKWSTNHHVAVQCFHIGSCEVTVLVVHEVLHIRVAHIAILLTRNHLKRLHDYLLVASLTDSSEPVLWVIITLRSYILTLTGVVDTLDGREREVNIPTGEVRLVVVHHLLEGVVSLLPSGTESHNQDDLVVALLAVDHAGHFLLIRLIVRRIVVVVVATSCEAHSRHEGNCCHHEKLNCLHFQFDLKS